jgi:hypothetical protein
LKIFAPGVAPHILTACVFVLAVGVMEHTCRLEFLHAGGRIAQIFFEYLTIMLAQKRRLERQFAREL